ncbi:MAG: tRNA (guanosine(37)-N1)-methyltransferase TrmD [Elusimicrobia bacterium RIFOXYC2_FULL_34_12]|nr:MAG: tRNA (guanosine(37)-N1)-methyltransferase TrmD [Elusimicrobia bacterium RIFOXYC2_FULL_34_12]OGS39026.1 MAG: tRNA (guanosine(37)-N1)-methyltransferase TrmD [Elusimicrobia bacterium RIFOXYD2_FULL_34_30]HAM39689.1 tRNA (guanosine(37)-N1)-methyltransferase TrmD [Elusimicrobiota bacterium]
MQIDILTLFPSLFESVFSESLIKKAVERKIINIRITNIRDFADGKHKTVDDKAYGGGAGMIMMAPPIVKAIRAVFRLRPRQKSCKVILLSPQGKVLNQQKAKELSKIQHLILICGHYGGVDERVLKFIDEEISIGNYVLTGGEIPAMVLVDTIGRLIPKVVGKKDSLEQDSLWNGKLISPVYTRPYNFCGIKVPKVLLSGNHKNIEKWKKENAVKNTIKKRPELIGLDKICKNNKRK